MKKINLKTLEKRIRVRPLNYDDFEQVVKLQAQCFPGMTTWKEEQFKSQIDIFPEGQLCIEFNGKIVASSSCLIVDFDLYEESDNWQTLSDFGYITNHDPDG